MHYRATILAFVSAVITLVLIVLELSPTVWTVSRLGLNPRVLGWVIGAVLLVFDAAMIWRNLEARDLTTRAVSLALPGLLSIAYLVWAYATWLGPTPPPPAIALTGNVARLSDFAASPSGWGGLYSANADWNARQPVQGETLYPSPLERGVAYRLSPQAGAWSNYGVAYTPSVKADVVAAQVYISYTAGISDSWVGLGVCARVDCGGGVLAGSYASIPVGVWTQLIVDLRDRHDSAGQALTAGLLYAQVFYAIQGRAADGSSPPPPVLAGLDDVVWYGTAGIQAPPGKVGPGEVLYNFEGGDTAGWVVDSSGVPTTTVSFSAEQVYRGSGALRLMTAFGGDRYAMVETVRPGPPPKGGWLAHVYVPPQDSPEARVWAKLYTYDGSGLWLASSPHPLERGWSTIIWDTESVPWSQNQEITIGVQLGTEPGAAYEGRIYIDDVDLFER